MPAKRRLILCLVLLLFAAGLFFYQNVVVDFCVYPRWAETLDITGKAVTIAHFEKLQRKLPSCAITWDVPLSSGSWPSDSAQIVLPSLAEEDVPALAYFPRLQQVDASACRDYGPLQALIAGYPDLKIDYWVVLGASTFAPEVRQITVRDVPAEQIVRLGCLPQLEAVVCAGGADAAALMRYCHDTGIAFSIQAGESVFPEDARSAVAANVEEDQLSLFALLPGLKRLYLQEPQASAGALAALRDSLETTAVNWEISRYGNVYATTEEELDFSGTDVSLEALREILPYFPDAQTAYLGASTMDNETLAAFREEMRDVVKVVWQVQLGKKLTARTDDTSFMPVREYVYYFNDKEAYNLRYCEDMVALDIGHMSIHNIEFVEFMPNLTYLILAHTQLQYIEPISTCKNLKFLELDWSPVRDLSPLVGCTALEDLNLGMTYASFEPIKQMTWLENLWVIDCNEGVAYSMAQALPDTKVQGSGSATVASGWRRLPNYYAMRDALGMYYMSWG